MFTNCQDTSSTDLELVTVLPMMRLIIAVVAGLVVGVVAIVLMTNVLSDAANGTPTNATLYVYGNR